jgi:hypothetical protein
MALVTQIERREAELAEAFAQVARVLLSADSVQDTLQKIVDLAVETIDGCDHAGVSLVEGTKVSTPNPYGPGTPLESRGLAFQGVGGYG